MCISWSKASIHDTNESKMAEIERGVGERGRERKGGGGERERERGGEREREREREREIDSLILYLEDGGFRPWPNLPTGPR